MINKLKTLLLSIMDEYQDPYYQAAIPQLAFFLFLSILPMVTLFSQVIGFFDLTVNDIISWAHIDIPPVLQDQFGSYFIKAVNTGGINIILIGTMLWSASKAQYAMIRLNDYALGIEKSPRSYMFRERIRAYVIILLAVVFLGVILVFLVYAPNVINLIFGDEPPFKIPSGIFVGLRWLIVLGLYFVLISAFYVLTPSDRMKFKDVFPGSVFASAGFIIVSLIYNEYVKLSINTSVIYGSLSSVVLLLLWFWILSWIICIGVILNKKVMELKNII